MYVISLCVNRIARFFLVQHITTGKNIANNHEICQMATMYVYQTAVK
jgi:hypothetical protein